MTDQEGAPRPKAKPSPAASEGDAVKDFQHTEPPVSQPAPPEPVEEPLGPDRYAPRHRAPGRAPLIRRRRIEVGHEEQVSWETPWTDAGGSGEAPPPPVEEPSFLDATRAELRNRPRVENELPEAFSARMLQARPATQQPEAHELPEGHDLPEERDETGDPLQPEGHDLPQDPDESRRAAQLTAYGPPHQEGASRVAEPVLGRFPAGGDVDEEPSQVPAGPRRTALQERQKKKRLWQTAGGFAALAIAVGGVAGAGLVVKKAVDTPRERVVLPPSQPEQKPMGGNTLLFGTKEKGSSGRGAIWMTLLNLDAETGTASVVSIPPHTAVDVPGRGLQGVGQAYGSGGIPLLLVSVENLLGITIDRYVELSDKDALVLFEQLEPLTVDVPAEVRVATGSKNQRARLIFVEGPQQIAPELLVKLLYVVGLDGDDVDLGARHLAFWDQLFDAYENPSELAAAVESAGAALGESDVPVQQHADFLAAMAEVPPEDLSFTVLPVRPISAGDSELYATDEEELRAFIEDNIGVEQGAREEVRVQILNGNGVPGIGQEVAERLVGEGFRMILSGNARRLNYRKTLIITYDSSPQEVALAERAKELLGVGEVQVSVQQQGIVDLTIVVGKDFLRVR